MSSQRIHRRAVLAAVGAVGLSGCLGFESAETDPQSSATRTDPQTTAAQEDAGTSESAQSPDATPAVTDEVVLEPLWRREFASELDFQHDGSRLYTPFRGGANQPTKPDGIRALNWETGELTWTAKLDTSPNAVFAAVATNRLYLASDGTLYAINTSDGSVLGRRSIGDTRGNPAVAGGTVVIGTSTPDENSLYGLDAETLERQWSVGHRLALENGRYAPSSFDGAVTTTDRIVAAYRNGRLSAYDPRSGEELWVTRFHTAGPDYGPFTDADERVIAVESEERSVCRLDPATGERMWTLEFETRTGSLPPIAQPVFAGNNGWIGAERHLIAFDTESGERRWHVELPAAVGQTLALTDRAIWVMISPDDDPRLLGFDRADGSLRSRYTDPPTVGYLYGSGDRVVISSREQVAGYQVQETTNGN